MPDAEIFIGLLITISLLVELARPLRVPYPILLVLAGLALGFVPGLPAPTLDPNTFFFFFLPPLVYAEAFVFSPEELRDNGIEIAVLAVGLVLATAAGVAVVAHAVAGLPWAPAFVLGAVVGSTDPVSASTVVQRLGVAPRVATVLEGESLINDGTALVVYKLAIAATVAGTFSLADAIPEFVWVSVGGVATGVVAAWLWGLLRRWIREPEVEIAFSLVMPFAAYFPAEQLGVSGVLAAVAAGLLVGRQADRMSAAARLRGEAFWEMLTFLLNSTLFLLVGLSFPSVLHRLGAHATADLIWQAVAIAATVIGLRLLWMFVLPALSALTDGRTWRPGRGEMVVLGWSGMRGGVSLAAALSVPVLAGGHPFPGRDQIIFLAYMVLLATLIVPGLTLGPLIRGLGVGTGEAQARTDAAARVQILHAALDHIDELAQSGELPEELAARMRDLYEARLSRATPAAEQHLDDGHPEWADAELRARRETIDAQRAALAELRESQSIGDRAAEDMEHELDEEARTYRETV